MGLLSTFDLKFRDKQHTEHIQEFGKGNVVLIKKSKLFLRIKIIFPIIGRTILLGATIFLIYEMVEEINKIFYRMTLFAVIMRCIANITLIKKILDYKIDFIIITPNSLTRYDQSGLFSRSSKVIELRNLKTVSVRKKGIINSLFNNGDLLFLSE